MKNLHKSAGLFACLAVASSLFVPLSEGQTPPATTTAARPAAVPQPKYSEEDLVKLINEVASQQKQIKLNQEATEAKIAVIQEDVRQARIFAARAGKQATP